MNIPSIKSFGTTVFKYTLFVLVSVMISAGAVLGQQAEAQPPNLDQCANGKAEDGPPVACSGAAWQNGNLNENNSQWVEGQYVPYRVVLNAASPGEVIVGTIQWDTTEGTKHAIDYIGTYNATNTLADPCNVVINGCGAMTTYPIPTDLRVTAAGVTQPAGVFTVWGGTITAVSSYIYEGPADYSGTSKAGLTLTIVADNDASTPLVIAWSGHIASRLDWGIEDSAISLPGSPYHMRIVGTGNQDRSMSVAGIIFPAFVSIVKDATPFPGHPTGTDFVFTSTFFGTPSSFFLDDDADATLSNTETRQTTDFVNPITVTEGLVAGWTLSGLVCVEQSGGLGTTADSTTNLGTRTATIRVQEGELVQCTFSNLESEPTAAGVSAEGRVVTAKGSGIAGINVKLTNANTGAVSTTTSDASGNFRFEDLEIGNLYVVTGATKGYTYNQVQFVPDDNVTGIKIVASTATKGGR